ncbi:MAG: signal recognition particle protein Srp19 [Desulfurococcales archaeon]|nr:signal recognition particle protein Srp19 [Desulfurococcales archaeon]
MSSRDYKGRRVVFWPVNIDSSATTREGRKIPRSEAVPQPRLDEIVKAAESLGLEPIVEDKAYPRSWYRQTRRVSVKKIGSKRRTLLEIAREIRRLRSRGRGG